MLGMAAFYISVQRYVYSPNAARTLLNPPASIAHFWLLATANSFKEILLSLIFVLERVR